MSLVQRVVPGRLQDRAQPLVRRLETVVRQFEWTWTKAVVASLAIFFVSFTVIAVIPSWWLYFADQKLGWGPCPCPDNLHFWLFILRDVVASGLYGTPFLMMVVVPLVLQKWRRRLRSESEARPTGGYR